VARRLGVPCLNSGYIYRAATLLVLESGGDFEDREKVARIVSGMRIRFQEDERATRVFVTERAALPERDVTSRLKDPDVTPQIYRIANDGHYRSLLVDLQRRSAGPEGVVAEGRDMGTVIFPQADYKFYLDASPEVRARREQHDLEAKGHSRRFEDVLSEVLDRDRHDRDREHAPLRVPPGALVISTDSLSIDQVVDAMLRRIETTRRAGRGAGVEVRNAP